MVSTVGLNRLGRRGVERDRPRAEFNSGVGVLLRRGMLGRDITGTVDDDGMLASDVIDDVIIE